jgi:hypothetical protein
MHWLYIFNLSCLRGLSNFQPGCLLTYQSCLSAIAWLVRSPPSVAERVLVIIVLAATNHGEASHGEDNHGEANLCTVKCATQKHLPVSDDLAIRYQIKLQ